MHHAINPSPHIGRETESAALQHALAFAKNGITQFVSIQGISGSGKTQLLHRFSSQIRGTVIQVPTSRNVAAPLAIFDSVIAAWLFEIGKLVAAEADLWRGRLLKDLGSDAYLLAHYSPVLNAFLPGAQTPITPLLAHRREQKDVLLRGFLQFLITSAAPVVLLIDEADFLDAQSAEFLQTLVEHHLRAPLLIACTQTTDKRGPYDLGVLSRLAPSHQTITLNTLQPDAIERVLTARLSIAASPQSRELSHALASITHGHVSTLYALLNDVTLDSSEYVTGSDADSHVRIALQRLANPDSIPCTVLRPLAIAGDAIMSRVGAREVALAYWDAAHQLKSLGAVQLAAEAFARVRLILQQEPSADENTVFLRTTLTAQATCVGEAGHLERAAHLFAEAKDLARTSLETASIHAAHAEVLTDNGMLVEALEVVRRGLQLLGVDLPINPGFLQVALARRRATLALGGRSGHAIMRLPPITSDATLLQMRLLHAALLVAHARSKHWMAWLCATLAERTFRHGMSDYGAISLAGFALLHRVNDGDDNLATAFSRAAIRCLPETQDPRLRASHALACLTLLDHHYRPLFDIIGDLQSAGTEAQASGSAHVAQSCALEQMIRRFWFAGPLAQIYHDATAQMGQTTRANSYTAISITMLWTFTAWLQDATATLPELASKFAQIKRAAKSVDALPCSDDFWLAAAAYVRGDFASAYHISCRVSRALAAHHLSFHGAMHTFVFGMSAARYQSTATGQPRSRCKQDLQKCLRRMARLNHCNPASFRVPYLLLAAADASMKLQADTAITHAEQAEAISAAVGNTLFAAFAADLRSVICLAQHDTTQAQIHTERARNHYRIWLVGDLASKQSTVGHIDASALQARLAALEYSKTEVAVAGGMAHHMRNALVSATAALGAKATAQAKEDSIVAARGLIATLQKEGFEDSLSSAKEAAKTLIDTVAHLAEAGDTARGSVARALRVVDELLRYAALEQAPVSLPTVDLGGIATAAVAHCQLRHPRIIWDVAVGASMQLRAPEEHLMLMCESLLNNAVDALNAKVDSAEKLVRVRVNNVDGWLELCIYDNGCGISVDLQSRIFDPFFTTKPSIKTGLGLALVRKVVMQYGGTITFQSTFGAGTTVLLKLPSVSKDAPLKPPAISDAGAEWVVDGCAISIRWSPQNQIAIAWRGTITVAGSRTYLPTLAKMALSRAEPVCLMYDFAELDGYDVQVVHDHANFSFQHLGRFKKIAVVKPNLAARLAVTAVASLQPVAVRTFETTAAAQAWLDQPA